MIDFRKATFIKSAAGKSGFLKDRPQVVFLGRSNVGKSSLINALCDNGKLMYVSKTPGRTQMLNYLDIESNYYLVDAPGYGYASGPIGRFEQLMLEYFDVTKNTYAIVLTDSRRPFTDDDLAIMDMLVEKQIPSLVVMTKADKLNQKEKAAAIKRVQTLYPEEEFLFVSVKTKAGIQELRGILAKQLQK